MLPLEKRKNSNLGMGECVNVGFDEEEVEERKGKLRGEGKSQKEKE